MIQRMKSRWFISVAVGFVVGLVLSGFWPNSPLHAVSTDHTENYSMATGPLDAEVEAVYLLDHLTGDLGALVIGKQPGKWTGFFKTNVAAEMGLDRQKDAKFLMVTGMAGLRRSGGTRQQPSSAVCYIAEVSSGKIAAFVVPWSPSMYAAGQMQNGVLQLAGPPLPFRQGLAGHTGTTKARAKERD
jgi:hypothetical protein